MSLLFYSVAALNEPADINLTHYLNLSPRFGLDQLFELISDFKTFLLFSLTCILEALAFIILSLKCFSVLFSWSA